MSEFVTSIKHDYVYGIRYKKRFNLFDKENNPVKSRRSM